MRLALYVWFSVSALVIAQLSIQSPTTAFITNRRKARSFVENKKGRKKEEKRTLTYCCSLIVVLATAMSSHPPTSGLLHLKDRHGNDIYFGNEGEVWSNPSPDITDYRDHAKKIRDLELKDSDVILASFPRSGTFWHHQILVMLMNDTTDYLGHMDRDHLNWCSADSLTGHDSSWLYVTHAPRFRLLPQQVKEKNVKVVYSYRNPKDCWASFYNFAHSTLLIPPYEGTWSHFFDLMMGGACWYGDWFDHVLDYENAAREHPDLVFLSCYELMKKDPVGQIMKINQFLGLNRSRQLCEQIAESCQFSKLKAAKELQDPQIHGEDAWKRGAPRLYRKGEIADWKNWFTVAQSEQLDAVFKKRMSESQLPVYFD